MVEDDMQADKDTESSVPIKLAVGLLAMYSLTIPFAEVYFNWRFVRQEGFFAWICLGEIIPSLKALVWPYFAVHASPAGGPTFRETLLNAVDLITSLSTVVVGLLVFGFLTSVLGAFVSKFRFGKAVFAFCIALCSSYSFAFALTIIALAIQGPMLPKNAVLPASTWLLIAGICLWESLAFGPECSAAPAIWAYVISGAIAALPLLILGSTFITLFTAIPLFGIAILLKLCMAYRQRGIPTGIRTQ